MTTAPPPPDAPAGPDDPTRVVPAAEVAAAAPPAADHARPAEPAEPGGQPAGVDGPTDGPIDVPADVEPTADHPVTEPAAPLLPTSLPTGPPAAPPAPRPAVVIPGSADVTGPTPVVTPERARQALVDLRNEVGKAVVGQHAAVTGLIVALLCRGHVLIEGVPGTAKTLLVRALATALRLESTRVQFTPDLMPGDVTGSLVHDARSGDFVFREGPVFTNLLIADEINRTPPKTQASLLEAMAERQVSVEGAARLLPDPFVVVATQNPVEYEGTYPLPEAQLDRFLLKLTMPLPSRDDEIGVLHRHASGFDPQDLAAAGMRAVAGPDELIAARAGVRGVTVRPEVLAYVVDVCRATRESPAVRLGVSPRGATALLAAARAWAWLSGRPYVTPDDVKALARPALRHRLELRPEAELEGATADAVLDGVLAAVPVPR